jgi:hypothetical protein
MLLDLMFWNTPPLDLVCVFTRKNDKLRERYFPELSHETRGQQVAVYFDNAVLGLLSGLMFRFLPSSLMALLPLLIITIFSVSFFLARLGLYFPKEFTKLSHSKLLLLLAISIYHVLWYFIFGLILAVVLW